MIVLGVDPGLNITGYGLLNDDSGKPVLIEAGIIRSTSSQPLEKRLFDLHDGLNAVIGEYKPDVLSIEELYSHYKHPKTAVIMGHARGVLFLAAGLTGIPVFSYSSTRVKKSLTGSGHASKEQIANMVCSILQCEAMSGPADVTDAIAAALCHLNAVSHGVFL